MAGASNATSFPVRPSSCPEPDGPTRLPHALGHFRERRRFATFFGLIVPEYEMICIALSLTTALERMADDPRSDAPSTTMQGRPGWASSGSSANGPVRIRGPGGLVPLLRGKGGLGLHRDRLRRLPQMACDGAGSAGRPQKGDPSRPFVGSQLTWRVRAGFTPCSAPATTRSACAACRKMTGKDWEDFATKLRPHLRREEGYDRRGGL